MQLNKSNTFLGLYIFLLTYIQAEITAAFLKLSGW